MRRFLIPALIAAAVATTALAQDYKAGSITVAQPWSRATPKGATVGGGYLRITNTGATPDRLVGGTTDVAKRFELHEMSMDGGVMRMRALPNGIEIAPGATVELKPGGYHVMFLDLAKPLAKGDTVKAQLTFEKAGKLDVEFTVEAIGGSPKGETKHKMH